MSIMQMYVVWNHASCRLYQPCEMYNIRGISDFGELPNWHVWVFSFLIMWRKIISTCYIAYYLQYMFRKANWYAATDIHTDVKHFAVRFISLCVAVNMLVLLQVWYKCNWILFVGFHLRWMIFKKDYCLPCWKVFLMICKTASNLYSLYS